VINKPRFEKWAYIQTLISAKSTPLKTNRKTNIQLKTQENGTTTERNPHIKPSYMLLMRGTTMFGEHLRQATDRCLSEKEGGKLPHNKKKQENKKVIFFLSCCYNTLEIPRSFVGISYSFPLHKYPSQSSTTFKRPSFLSILQSFPVLSSL